MNAKEYNNLAGELVNAMRPLEEFIWKVDGMEETSTDERMMKAFESLIGALNDLQRARDTLVLAGEEERKAGN